MSDILIFFGIFVVLHSLQNVTNFAINEEQIDPCENWQFKCENGQYVASAFICDGLQDCKDASDETYDRCQNKSLTKCDELHFQCQYGACIEKQYQCDGVKHCIDGSDESSDICNAFNDESNKIRTRRQANKSCALPTSSVDKTVDFHCNGDLSRTCKPINGYFPEGSAATVTCTADYYMQDSINSSAHLCYNGRWSPPITKCLKKCDQLNPVNLILQCYHGGVSIDNCDSNSILLAGTKIRPSCISSYKYDIPPSYPEITCNKDGRWNHMLHSCVPVCGKPYVSAQPLIFGGKLESIGGSPWHVAIYDNKKELSICGGTIISEKLVISAAHCFEENCEGVRCVDDFELVVGKHTNNYSVIDNSFQRTMKIEKILFSNSGYHGIKTRHTADIAILILTHSIPVSPVVLPACIPWDDLRNDRQPLEGEIGKVAGWGRTENGTLSAILKTLDLPFVSYKQCLEMVDNSFLPFLTIDKFCAGTGNRTGATLLDGDSGGGLLFEDKGLFYLRGVVSVKQPSSNSVTLFTDLNKYVNWIISVHHNVETNHQIQPNSVLNQDSILLDVKNATTTTKLMNEGNHGWNNTRKINQEEESKRRLIDEAVNHIKSFQYYAAEQKLANTDPHTYSEVAHEVYNSDGEGSFNLLLNFSDYIVSKEDKLEIISFLFYKTAYKGSNDLGKFLQISQAVRKGILDRSSGFPAAERIYQNVNNLIRKAATGQISSAFIKNDDSWSTVAQLTADIVTKCEECAFKICSSVVDTVWDKITIEDLLVRTRHNLNLIKVDFGIHLAAADKLEHIGALNTSSTITLAFYINVTMHHSSYKEMSADLRFRYEKVSKKLSRHYQDLKEAIIKPAAKFISSAFENDNSWSTVAQLSTDITDKCEECIFKIYSSVVETVWDKITIEDLLTREDRNLNSMIEDVAIHLAAANKLERLGALNTSSTKTLALHINETLHEPDYKHLNEDLRSRYEKVAKKLF